METRDSKRGLKKSERISARIMFGFKGVSIGFLKGIYRSFYKDAMGISVRIL